MIEAIELTSTRRSRGVGGGAVEKVSFDVYPGQVTALLGAPGSGKSTVLRLMVELEPGGGRTLFGGRPYRALRPAVREVGLALNPDAVHPGRTVQAHLQLYTAGGGVPKARVAEVLEVAGLSTQATVRCGRLDSGQRQRLAIAAALLGDPGALILDEPYALDDHGMSWFHALIRAYAAQGRTVLVAATDPDTLAGTADHVVVLRRDEHDGLSRVIGSRSAAEVFDERRATVVQVRSPEAARLAAALEAEGASLAPAGPGALQVRGLDRARIGEVAHVAGVCLHELSEVGHDDVYGLRPVPRRRELLHGVDHDGETWRSGVRLVVEEIEAIEEAVVEVAAEADAETVSVGARVVGEAGTTIATSVDSPTVSAGPAAPYAAEATPTSVGGQASQGSVADRQTQTRGVADVASSPAAEADQQAARTEPAKPSVAASWRTQGSVAGSRWSAVKGSQPSQGSVSRRPVSAQEDASASTAPELSKPVPAAGTDPQSTPASIHSAPVLIQRVPVPSIAPPIPGKPRGVSRRTTSFGLRWSRGKPQPPVVPAPEHAAAAAPVQVQPAVPFTVALPAPEQDAAGEGMTPWRAVAVRSSQQSQQASVAEAAQAEQETSR